MAHSGQAHDYFCALPDACLEVGSMVLGSQQKLKKNLNGDTTHAKQIIYTGNYYQITPGWESVIWKGYQIESHHLRYPVQEAPGSPGNHSLAL
jgi:hypothetical protein